MKIIASYIKLLHLAMVIIVLVSVVAGLNGADFSHFFNGLTPSTNEPVKEAWVS